MEKLGSGLIAKRSFHLDGVVVCAISFEHGPGDGVLKGFQKVACLCFFMSVGADQDSQEVPQIDGEWN